MNAHDPDTEPHSHDRGLAFDVSTLIQRRQALKLFASAAGLVALASCGSDTTSGSSTAASTTGVTTGSSTGTSLPATAASTATTASAATTASSASRSTAASTGTANLTAIPEETAGPFPGDGSNGVNVLTQSGIVRGDITSSFGSATGVATEATAAGSVMATSQLALPKEASDPVYATPGYEKSVGNLAAISLASDMVFSDGAEQETPAVSGSVTDGFVMTLQVPVTV